MRRLTIPTLLALCVVFLSFAGLRAEKEKAGDKAVPGRLTLHARKQVETKEGSKEYRPLFETLDWEASKTAIVVCDMWDRHWCPAATGRVGEMAPRMNEVLVAARKQGALIIHCPSDTLDFYKDTPQRKLAQQAPVVETRVPLQRWCKIDLTKEAPLPIDDSDGGCDCENKGSHKAWSRQHPALKIEDGDAVTDSAEAYYLMKQRGIQNVVVMGVHTNMCVLGRPFSIRQMVMQGQNVVLMRDLTDTMYNPEKSPYVSHFTGTDLVVDHIERHWCPSITSADFLGGKPFRFKDDARKRLVIIMADDEYAPEKTLPAFARKELGRDFEVTLAFEHPSDKFRLVGLDPIADADLLLIAARRHPLPPEQIEAVKKFAAAGKPIVGIRTASHAFSLRDGALPPGRADWKTIDKDLFGCNYNFHYPKTTDTGPNTLVRRSGSADSPLLKGVEAEFGSPSWMYKVQPLAAGTTLLLTGQVVNDTATEPVAWTWKRPDGGKSFYTSLGHPGDFEAPSFRKLLVNALKWAAE